MEDWEEDPREKAYEAVPLISKNDRDDDHPLISHPYQPIFFLSSVTWAT